LQFFDANGIPVIEGLQGSALVHRDNDCLPIAFLL
jgi:hypothetical protein